MRWKGRRVSSNVEDRRGGGGVKAGGISILGLVVAFVAWKFFGVDPQQAYQATKQVTSQAQPAETKGLDHPTPEQQEAMDFIGTVLADTEDTWTQVFQQQLNSQYVEPKLVMFSGVVNSGCGTAQSAMGPFYCPADRKVYIDTTFFKDMRQQMGISGEQNSTELSRQDQAGDFAQAYVVAHELGHNFGSSHTHAYDVDHGYNLPIDCCYATAGGVCQNYQPAMNLPGLGTLTGGSTATHPGTIMSYCHLVSGGSQNLSMSFGTNHPYGVDAFRVPEQMRSTVETYAAAYPQCLVPNVTVSPTVFGFASVSKWHESFVANQALPLIGDFNGDHLDDVASFAQYTSHKVFVALSTGTKLATKTLWKTQFALANEEVAVGDFNGDGKTDLMSLTHNNLRQVYVAPSNGNSFDNPRLWFSLKSAQDGLPVIGDFNGDGKDDLATLKRGKGLILVSLSNGSLFGSQTQWSDALPLNVQQIVVGDFNGDKQTDLGFSFSNGEVKVSLSTGTSFTPATVWHTSLATGASQLVAGDFNADGKDDMASYLPTESGGIYLALAEDGKFGINQKAHNWFAPYDQVIKVGRFTHDSASDVISFTRGSTADVWLATDLKQ